MHPSIAHFPNMQFYQGKIFSRGALHAYELPCVQIRLLNSCKMQLTSHSRNLNERIRVWEISAVIDNSGTVVERHKVCFTV